VPSIRLGKFKVKVLLTGTVGGSTTSKLDFSDNTFKILNVVSPSAAAVLAPSALASISEALSKIVEGLARILNR
jgi:hypothetical protein